METLLKQTDSIIRAMEYTQQNKPEILEYMKATNPRIETFFTKVGFKISVPVVDIKTKERGVAPMLYMDIARPIWRDNLFCLLSECTNHHLSIIDHGTPERVIDLTAPDLMKQLARFNRYYKKANIEMTVETDKDTIRDFMIANTERFALRRNQEPIYDVNVLNAYIEDAHLFNHKFYGVVDKATDEQGIIEVANDVSRGVVHWVNTYRGVETENTRFGNNCLMHLISSLNLGIYKTLNLGIDTFDYKTLWTQKQTFAKGFDYKE